jgi:protein-tyrosine phosphatase
MSNRILFLCTGNYYRSRFAEIVFNDLAHRYGLAWSAFSRALAIEKGGCNVGPISPFTRKACVARGLAIPEPTPFPCGVHADDFASAARVIAMKEAEHRRYMCEKFPDWEPRVEYWHVHDLDAAPFEHACAQVEQHIVELVQELRRSVA